MTLNRFLLPAGLVAMSAFAQSERDARNGMNLPGTKTHFKLKTYNLEEWTQRRAALRRQVLAAAGLSLMPPRTPLSPRIFDRQEQPDFTVEKVWIETWPGLFLAGNLYRPKAAGRHPAVLHPHGHWKRGRLEDTDEYSGPALGANFARQGYVVFAYDMLGYTDTKQVAHDFGHSAVEQLWKFGPLGLQLWNSIRALDFLETLPDVDAKRIGVTGASGGATQTFLLAAVDDRVAATAPVNMISAIFQGGSPCENAPGLRVGTNNVEIASLMAPRPMLIVAATGDWTKNAPREECPAVRTIYKLYGRADQMECRQFEAKHNYNRASREAVYAFFRKTIAPEAPAGYRESPHGLDPDRLRLLPSSPPPANVLNQEGLFAQWKKESATLAAQLSDFELRDALSALTGVSWPAKVSKDTLSQRSFSIEAMDMIREGSGSAESDKPFKEPPGEKMHLSREGVGDRIPALWIPGKSGKLVLLVHESGIRAALKSMAFSQRMERRDSILLIDPFQVGAATGPRDRGGRYFTTFNQTDDANRMQDIVTALAWLRSRQAAPMELVGIGKAALWCRFAAAIAPYQLTLDAPLPGFGGSEKEYVDLFLVPGILRGGGMNTVRRLARIAD